MRHTHFVAAQLQMISEEHERFTSHIPNLPDVQAAWLLWVHCANARANHMLARAHDARLWSCLFHILGIAEDMCDDVERATASLPLAMAKIGFEERNADQPVCFLADSLPMVQKRHPDVANIWQPPKHAVFGGRSPRHALPGFTLPSWHELALGVRPPPRVPEENEPGTSRTGWQREAGPATPSHLWGFSRPSYRTLQQKSRLKVVSVFRWCSGVFRGVQVFGVYEV